MSFEKLQNQGFFLTQIELPATIRQFVLARVWKELDQALAKEAGPGGRIFQYLSGHAQFSQIEFIISIRSSREFPDDDGIWHDDGSRKLAFSLSLTLDPQAIQGGCLEVRRKGQIESSKISTPEFGTLIVFATGETPEIHPGYEHKIGKVTAGERIVMAGWCT
ncbi:MAG: 2OG-Fe(II) oxygenase [Bdellovibrionales bacterium]|nr:2OG-Fe(II) oxygenase [Bdellovibrionales bacterium]